MPKIVYDMEEVKIISKAHGFNKGGEKTIMPTCTSSKFQDNHLVVEPKIIEVGKVKEGKHQQDAVQSAEGLCRTICTGHHASTPHLLKTMVKETPKYRIRKLTPRECFRLMGVDDKDIDAIQAAGISNSQQYKMAGNSIVVDVLYHQFVKAFIDNSPTEPFYQQTLF